MAEGNGQPVEQWFEELVGEIREIHDEVIQTGGAAGEHTARLLGSVGRAFQTAFGQPIYEPDMEKAAALFHGIICNHAFVDGNKRTATLTALYFLIARHSLQEAPGPLQVRLLGEVAIETALGNLDVQEVVTWFRRILDLADGLGEA